MYKFTLTLIVYEKVVLPVLYLVVEILSSLFFSILNIFITVVLKSITYASSGIISATLFCSFEWDMFSW